MGVAVGGMRLRKKLTTACKEFFNERAASRELKNGDGRAGGRRGHGKKRVKDKEKIPEVKRAIAREGVTVSFAVGLSYHKNIVKTGRDLHRIFLFLFCPDHRAGVLPVDRLFDVAPLVAVYDPDFPDMDGLL